MKVGPLTVEESGIEIVEAQPIGASKVVEAQARTFDVSADGLDLRVADITFVSGERDVRTLLARSEDPRHRRLERGLRIGVKRSTRDRLWMQLRVPAPGRRGQDTFHKTTLEELDTATGLDARQALKDAGAVTVDTRKHAIGDIGRSRNQLCVTFREGDEPSSVPIVAYALTPVLALLESSDAS